MRPKVSFVILKGARRNIPHDEPLGQSETKTITLRIHSIQVIPSGLLMSYRISLSEGVASVVSSRQRSGYYSSTTDLTDLTDSVLWRGLGARQKPEKPLGEDGGRCPCCYTSALVL